MSKEKAIEKIQYAAMQIASVYACSAIFDEKTKVIEGRQKVFEKSIVNLHDALKELEGQNMDSNYDVIQGDCPNCPFADLFGGFCFYYRFYPANIGYGEATCRCEKLKPNKD